MELLGLSLELDHDEGLVVRTSLDLEGPELDILLDDLIGKLSSDESLGVENGVDGVSGGLVLGGVTNKSFSLSKSNIRGCGSLTLIICDDFHFIVLPNSNT